VRRPRTTIRGLCPCLAAAVLAAACGGGDSSPSTGGPPAQTRPPAQSQPPTALPPAGTQPAGQTPQSGADGIVESRTGKSRLLVIGDSLTVGVAPLLQPALPGWTVAVDALGGRPLAVGMQILEATKFPPDGSVVLGMGLFTNDPPADVERLRAAVEESLEHTGPRGCVIWATLSRPPISGVSYEAANTMLNRLAAEEKRLRIVQWAKEIQANPALMSPDQIHPGPEGYKLRAKLYADAAMSC
jgi:lysophospholipase L1-like esterase